MQPNYDRPLEALSDDELLARYRQITGGLDSETTAEDFGQLETIRGELERRGLEEGQPVSSNEPNSQAGHGESVIDSSSGAVPNPPR